MGIKTAEALPGIIGGIISWILNRAKDVVGWVSQNLWALVVGVGGLIYTFIILHQKLLQSVGSFTHQHFRCLVLSAFKSCHMIDIMLPCKPNICHARDIMLPCKPNIYHVSVIQESNSEKSSVLILIILKQCESERDNKLG